MAYMEFLANSYRAKLIILNIHTVKFCLANAMHNLKLFKITHICLIWDQTFRNLVG